MITSIKHTCYTVKTRKYLPGVVTPLTPMCVTCCTTNNYKLYKGVTVGVKGVKSA